MSYLGSPESECTDFTCCSLCLIEVLKALMRIDLWCNARDIVIYLNKQRNKNATKERNLEPDVYYNIYCRLFDADVNWQRPLYRKVEKLRLWNDHFNLRTVNCS